MKQQVETVASTFRATMRTKHFNLGVEDIVKNKGWNISYDTWDNNKQWCYERGRLYAIYTKGRVPVKYKKAVTSQAINAYINGRIERAII
jgi:hypothetical protein